MEALQFTEFETHTAQNPRFEIGITIPHSATLGEILHQNLGIREMLRREKVKFRKLNVASRIDADFGAWGLAQALVGYLQSEGVTVHIIRSKLSRVIADVGRYKLQQGVNTVFADPENFQRIQEIHAQALQEYLGCVESVRGNIKMLLDIHTMADHPRKEHVSLSPETIANETYATSWLDPDRSITRKTNLVHDPSGKGKSLADKMMHIFQDVFQKAGHPSVPKECFFASLSSLWYNTKSYIYLCLKNF